MGADEAAQPPVTMANTRDEIIDAAVDDAILPDPAAADGMTKAELIALWFGG